MTTCTAQRLYNLAAEIDTAADEAERVAQACTGRAHQQALEAARHLTRLADELAYTAHTSITTTKENA